MRKILLFFVAILVITTSFTSLPAASVIPVTVPTENPDPGTVKTAVASFNALSKAERKAKIKAAKNELKAYKAAKKAGKEPSTNTILLVILAILLPPLAVYLHQGEINKKFWISLLLTLLFWLPGVIYALIVILGNGG
ncbi:MAG: YqaE/Pmp3 family membrane protein [Bacteroidota bacterium]|nr:YqaE/Pmp3 family membrane protein [Bacteroidota bacterium]